MTMIRLMAICGVIVTFFASPCGADYTVQDRGVWPETWPSELEPLREQSRTLEGPKQPVRQYQIPFTKREEFEAAWPHILKVKSKGAPIVLVRPSTKADSLTVKPAGVSIHSPPANTSNPESAVDKVNFRERWMWTTYIYLVVDGEIVDLNRLPLPPDTPVIDERFLDEKGAPTSEATRSETTK